MESFSKYLDHAKDRAAIATDVDIARDFGVGRSTISGMRSGRIFPNEKQMIQLAKKANLDPAEALVLRSIWKSHGETKVAYEKLLKLSRMASKTFAYIVFAVFAYMGNVPQTAVARDIAPIEISDNYSILIIMRTKGCFVSVAY